MNLSQTISFEGEGSEKGIYGGVSLEGGVDKRVFSLPPSSAPDLSNYQPDVFLEVERSTTPRPSPVLELPEILRRGVGL